MTIDANKAADGAAVYSGAALTLTAVNMMNNIASAGSVVKGTGNVTYKSGTVSANEATNGDIFTISGTATFGGDIDVDGNATNIVIIENNKAVGGKILNVTGDADLDQVQFLTNTGDNGIIALGAKGNLKTVTVSGNEAANGNILEITGKATLENVDVTGNTGSSVIKLADTATVATLTAVKVQGNTATATDGAILYLANGATVKDVTIGGTEAGQGNTAAKGSTVYLAGGSLTLNDNTDMLVITGNTAEEGGALYVANGATFTWELDKAVGSNINGNTAVNGGMIYNAGTVTIKRAPDAANTEGYFLKGNTANGKGGVIYNENGTLNLGYVTVSENSAADGSAVYILGGTAYIFASTFVSNAGGENGYVLTNAGGTLNMAQVTVGFNTVNGVNAAGGTTNMFNSVVSGNGTENVRGLTVDALYTNGNAVNSDPALIFKGGTLADSYDTVTGTLELASFFLNEALRNGIASTAISVVSNGKFGEFKYDNDTTDIANNTKDQYGNFFYGNYIQNGHGYIAGARVIAPEDYPTDLAWVVTTGNDVVSVTDGMTSLREAVAYVNKHGGEIIEASGILKVTPNGSGYTYTYGTSPD